MGGEWGSVGEALTVGGWRGGGGGGGGRGGGGGLGTHWKPLNTSKTLARGARVVGSVAVVGGGGGQVVGSVGGEVGVVGVGGGVGALPRWGPRRSP